MTLFRDWLGQAQIDGIVWTLETEAKLYIFFLLFLISDWKRQAVSPCGHLHNSIARIAAWRCV
jgi:hypothetical protein